MFKLTRDGQGTDGSLFGDHKQLYFVGALAALCTLAWTAARMSSAWPEQRRVTQNFSDSQSLVANRQQTLSREGGTSFYPHRLIALYSIPGFMFTERLIVHDDLMTVMTY